MREILVIAGFIAVGYGAYLLIENSNVLAKKSKKKRCGCGCGGNGGGHEPDLMPNSALQHFDTRFLTLFPTPVGSGPGMLPAHPSNTNFDLVDN